MTTLMFLALFEMPSWPTVALGIVVAFFAVLNGIQWKQKQSALLLAQQTAAQVQTAQLEAQVKVTTAEQEALNWKTAADAGRVTFEFAEKELQVVRERCQRLEENTDVLTKDNAVLRSRTDLDALSKALSSEGRRAQEMHEAILHGLENLAGSVSEMTKRIFEMTEQSKHRDAQYATLIGSQSELIKSLQSQMNLRDAMPARKAR